MVKNHKYGEKKAQAIKVLSAAIIVSINKTKKFTTENTARYNKNRNHPQQ